MSLTPYVPGCSPHPFTDEENITGLVKSGHDKIELLMLGAGILRPATQLNQGIPSPHTLFLMADFANAAVVQTQQSAIATGDGANGTKGRIVGAICKASCRCGRTM